MNDIDAISKDNESQVVEWAESWHENILNGFVNMPTDMIRGNSSDDEKERFRV